MVNPRYPAEARSSTAHTSLRQECSPGSRPMTLTRRRAALAKVRARERHRRLDFCQKTAHQLAHANAVVVLEKLPAKHDAAGQARRRPEQPGQLSAERRCCQVGPEQRNLVERLVQGSSNLTWVAIA